MDALGFELAVELLDEAFEGRALELEPQFANGLGEDLLKFGSGLLEIAHWATESSIPRGRSWHGGAYRVGYLYFVPCSTVLRTVLDALRAWRWWGLQAWGSSRWSARGAVGKRVSPR